MHYRVLMMSSLPLSSPWNGADKNFGRLLVQKDSTNEYLIQTGRQDDWPAHVIPIRSSGSESMPSEVQKLRAFHYLLQNSGRANLIHIVASFNNPSRPATALLNTWHRVSRKPLVHTLPSIGDLPVNPQNFLADATVVVSKHSRKRLEDQGIRNVFQIDPPLEIEKLRPIEPAEQLRQRLVIGSQAVLYPAHFGPLSGIREALQAFSLVLPTLPNATLVLACRAHPWQNPDEETRRVFAFARELGIAERIRMVGNVNDMASLISACAMTILVPAQLVSKMDQPLVILESLALKRPVIVSNQPPMNETLLGGGGLPVPFGDIPALAAAITRLITNQAEYKYIAEQGYRAVKQRCSPEKLIDRYHTIYQTLMEVSHRWDDRWMKRKII